MPSLCVLHSRRDVGCGCAECVAFTHLHLGSALENARDRVADMRHNNCSLNAPRGGLGQFERQ